MKWIFLNAQHRLAFAVRHPSYAARSILRQLTLADERFLALATGRPVSEIYKFFNEPSRHDRFLEHLRSCQAEFAKAEFESADLYGKKVLLQYAVVRAMQPEVLVETGVANGVSTTYLLLALHHNKKGVLHSIEIGDTSYLPHGRQAGWIAPEWLRGRWKPCVGDSKEVLSPLLRQLGRVDVFIHDSLHTYEHMLFEMETAYPYVRPGGLRLADDALWNNAFWEFKSKVGASIGTIVRGVGVLRK